jgi:YD repeat-containing protein
MLRCSRQSLARRTSRCEHVFRENVRSLKHRLIFPKLRMIVAILGVWLMLAQFLPALVATAQADITYVYDTAGRLSYVIDPSGNVVKYAYDSDGNILQVTNTHPSGVTIDSLSPNNGSIGTSVTIFGTGFSTTPGQNSVSFNGKAATVAASSTTTISTTVPTGATTGTVSVNSVNGPSFTVH